jgi:hypothetical protein
VNRKSTPVIPEAILQFTAPDGSVSQHPAAADQAAGVAVAGSGRWLDNTVHIPLLTLSTISEWLGHASPTSTSRYARCGPKDTQLLVP